MGKSIILMIIVIVLAIGFFLLVTGIYQSEHLQAPRASLRATEAGNGFVKLEHQGGADIVLSDLKIIVEQGSSRVVYDKAGKSVDRYVAGDKLIIAPNGMSLNGRTLNTGTISVKTEFTPSNRSDKIIVTIIDIPSSQAIAQVRIQTEGTFFN